MINYILKIKYIFINNNNKSLLIVFVNNLIIFNWFSKKQNFLLKLVK
jgi:hypothetical protein